MNQSLSAEKRDLAGQISLWLVDDNEEFRQGFGLLLECGFGFNLIRHFGSAEAAIAALNTGSNPDVILLDMKLPGISGATAVCEIKRQSPSTHIFMFSTYFNASGAAKALASGAVAYFTKYQPYEEVVAAVCAVPLMHLHSKNERG